MLRSRLTLAKSWRMQSLVTAAAAACADVPFTVSFLPHFLGIETEGYILGCICISDENR